MLRIPLQSRKGNLALIILGTIYSLASLIVLARFIIDVGDATGGLERVMQVSLVVSALCGAWFIVTALRNLGVHPTARSLAHFRG